MASIKRLIRRSPVLLMIVLLSGILTVLITQPTGTAARVEAGDVAKVTYKSPRSVTYKSQLKTSEAEQRAADQVAPVLRADLTAASQQEGKVTAAITALTTIRDSLIPATDKVAQAQQVVLFTDAEAQQLLGLDAAAWSQTQSVLREVFGQLQQGQVKPTDLPDAGRLISDRLPGGLSRPVRDSLVTLGHQLLVPNYLVDEEATRGARDQAKATVQPISYTVERDQIVASRGQVFSEFDVERLTAIGLARPVFDWQKTLGIFLLVLIFSALLLYLAPQHSRQVLYPRRVIGLLAVFAIGTVLAGVFITPTQPIFAYVLPLAAPALLLAIFFGFRLAMLATISLTAFFALASGGSFELFLIHLAAAVSAVLLARRINTIPGFLQAGAVVAVVVFLGMAAFNLLTGALTPGNLPKFLLASGLNGALTATFVFAGSAFLGRPLGIVTFLQLLELENPRRPLLRRLANEMPGTYSHSLRIARLVEAVAENVGADALLVRVQALYHDIGKASFPEYFVENQASANPHRGLSPKDSAEVLRAHISEGLALAQQERIPEQVAAAIPEHHGTALMEFFYEKAKGRGTRPKPSDFRYLGPKPRSRETAILMLADATEAASRSLDRPTEAQLRELIQRLITARIDDGQLDEAPLSTHDLTIIKEGFVHALLSDQHKRVPYPTVDART